MANDSPAPKWRNFVIWSAVGAIFYVVVLFAAISIRAEGVLGLLLKGEHGATLFVLGLIVTAVWQGFSKRNSYISLRTFRTFSIWSAVAAALVALAKWGFSALASTGALATMGVSETCAALVGLGLLIYALFVGVFVSAAYAGARFMPAESVGSIRERGRTPIYSLISVATMGLSLILLSLSGARGVLSPAVALVVVLVLLAITTAVSLAMWPQLDELSHTISRETGNAAFYLILVLGGGWAMLAHLGFAAAPAPLDWLTMFTLIMFVAAFVAAARRGLLRRR